MIDMERNAPKKEKGTYKAPIDSAKNQLQCTKYNKTSHQKGLTSSSEPIILTRLEIHELLSNSIKTFNKIIVSEKTRFASILKKKRKNIEDGLIKNNLK